MKGKWNEKRAGRARERPQRPVVHEDTVVRSLRVQDVNRAYLPLKARLALVRTQ